MENSSSQANTTLKRDLHQQVTDAITRQLESGTIPWQQPWIGCDKQVLALPKNAITGHKYRGINIILLWGMAIEREYPIQEWATFKQWSPKKELIRKGEKGSLIVYYDTFEKEVEGELQKIPFLKSSIVFNRCQLASFKPEAYEPPLMADPVKTIDRVEEFIANTKAVIEHGGNRACYIPMHDKIQMPFPEKFLESASLGATEHYYSTLLHELTHWSGAKHRLDRQFGKKFGDQQYAVEELVAELGAAFMCAELEITTNGKVEDYASYIEHWLKILKNNKDFLITAASQASKATDFLFQYERSLL